MNSPTTKPAALRLAAIMIGLGTAFGAVSLASSEPPPASAPAPGTDPNLRRLPGGYVHTWLDFPKLRGKSIYSEEHVQYQPEMGYASVVVFLASWCERCQRLIGSLEALRERFKNLPVRVLYVFSHDTLADAQGFAKEYKVKGPAVLSNHDILKTFHNPPLPSIYIGDRHGWLLQRFLDSEAKDIETTRRLLTMLTEI